MMVHVLIMATQGKTLATRNCTSDSVLQHGIVIFHNNLPALILFILFTMMSVILSTDI